MEGKLGLSLMRERKDCVARTTSTGTFTEATLQHITRKGENLPQAREVFLTSEPLRLVFQNKTTFWKIFSGKIVCVTRWYADWVIGVVEGEWGGYMEDEGE